MAESFAINIAENVLGKLGSLAYQEISLAWGVKRELKELEDTLSTIKAVLLDAEEQQANNRELSIWLGKLKDVCYDAVDVLDEFEYEALWQQVVKRGGIIRKVRNYFSCSNRLAFRFKMGHKIKEINEKLDKISAEKDKFNLTRKVENRRDVYEERETHSFVNTSDVIGRDKDKEYIIQLLMRSSDHENVSIIPIVGIGGLGKTALAKLVYNDETVKKHFQSKMWVCVSYDFDVNKLIRKIIKSASDRDSDDLSIDHMQTRLRDALRGTKFLLILDDVWNDDHSKWVELKSLLTVGAGGSKIIVTTRSPLVASIMGTIPAYILEGLPHKECLSLLVKWAFRDGEEKWYPNLIEIGNEIVKKCRGVPLAVRTLGSLLFLKTDVHDWLRVKDSEIWKLEQKESDILHALKLSYDAMPAYLKQCFAFCSIFPKGFEFKNFELIYLWMAQGFLQFSTENLELEEMGRQCISELWSKSFFQKDFEEVSTFFSIFRMHDLVHDLALSVAEGEYLTVSSRTRNVSSRLRHVSISSREEDSTFLVQLYNVRTIQWQPGPRSEAAMETCISRFRNLRMLDLSDSKIEVLPSSMGKLKHLRYFNLSGNRSMKKLPSSICMLLNLQTLKLKHCTGLKELPKDIGNLICLRYLWLTTKEMVLPEKGIGCLKSLRFLGIIDCCNLKSLNEGIQRLSHLRTLVIYNCEKLESLPHSMKHLTALETLDIQQCENLNLMELEEDIQGLRLGLRTLFIWYLPQLVALPRWLQGAASTLQHICIQDCGVTELPEWLQNLTLLQRLEIRFCPKLLALPEGMHRLAALRKLTIVNCPILMRRCKPETGMDWPKIAHVPEITLKEVMFDEEEEKPSAEIRSHECG